MTSTSVDAEWQPSELELSRRALRRRATTRTVLTAFGSSIALLAVLIVVVVNTPGWAIVSQTFFDPQVAL